MELYVIVREGWEYDDNWYSRPESEGETLISAFRSRAKAAIELDKLNEAEREKWSKYPRRTETGKTIEATHKIKVIEVDESEIEGA